MCKVTNKYITRGIILVEKENKKVSNRLEGAWLISVVSIVAVGVVAIFFALGEKAENNSEMRNYLNEYFSNVEMNISEEEFTSLLEELPQQYTYAKELKSGKVEKGDSTKEIQVVIDSTKSSLKFKLHIVITENKLSYINNRGASPF